MKRYTPSLDDCINPVMDEKDDGEYVLLDDVWEWLLNTARLPEKQAREIAEDLCEELGIEPARNNRFA